MSEIPEGWPTIEAVDLQEYLDVFAMFPADHVGQTRAELRQQVITYIAEDKANELEQSTAFSDLWAPFEADMGWDDDEEFCPKCFAGLESSEHREKCGEPA